MGDASGGYAGPDAGYSGATAYSTDQPATYTEDTQPGVYAEEAQPTTYTGGAHQRRSTVAGSPRGTRGVAAPVRVKGGGTLAAVGFLTAVLGVWVAIIPYVGPTFSFGATGTPAWRWNLLHSLLWLAPGAVAIVCGLTIIAQVPSLRNGRGGRGARWVGFLTFLCGAWLAIGPLAWGVMERGAVFRGGSPWHVFLTRLAYSYGPAAILAMLGGMAMGLVVGRRLTGLAMTGAFPAASSSIPTEYSQPY
jgi:hypothetical protein